MEDEQTQFASFEDAPEYFEMLPILLGVDLQRDPTPDQNQSEVDLFQKLLRIVGKYQEQPYLLDPYLERMVTPIVETFKAHTVQYNTVRRSAKDAPYSPARLGRLTALLCAFIQNRGRKTIVNFFSHQVADLPVALEYLTVVDGPARNRAQWPLRYLAILWLSLICMIPFDLSKFDGDDIWFNENSPPSISQRLEMLATEYLPQSGLEREAAAILLSKLYTRKDTGILLVDFLARSLAYFEASPSIFKTIGILHVLCEITKSGVPEQVAPHVTLMRRALAVIEIDTSLMSNTLVRKFRVKLEGRLAVGTIPSTRPTALRVRHLHQNSDAHQNESEIMDDDSHEIDIPEDVERDISTLLGSLQDKDTTVRYSASKHLARICSRLPLYLTEQVLENVLQLFAVHSVPSGKVEDLPAVAEATWHGACLACAEMARRALIPRNYLRQLLELLKKALLFDIRKGAHSVGSSVRDAASYVLWALARSHDSEGMKPHAMSLAQRLVAVSLYDREIHIRRAASAAFQENVGRMSVLPHGIDVLRKTDFFAIGVRKNAFIIAAPQVAEHMEYRPALIDHLIDQTLIHWDPSMRLLGAQSLRAICELDLKNLGPKAEERVVLLLQSADANHVHGGLLGLWELASSYQTDGCLEAERLKIFNHLTRIPTSMIQKHRHEKILEATCLLIASSISLSALLPETPPRSLWRMIVELGLRHREIVVQEAAASAVKSYSQLVDCSSDILTSIFTYVEDFAKGGSVVRQSLARTLGILAYDEHDHAVHDALSCVLDGVDPTSNIFSSSVETRRNCYSAMTEILRTLDSKIPQALNPLIVNRVLRACISGLDDYTLDERGDVGSWIRIVCIRGLCSAVEILFNLSGSLETHGSLQAWISQEMYHEILGGILKQGVERLDNVRRQAGESFLRLIKNGPPKLEVVNGWKAHGDSLLTRLLLSDDEELGWNDGQWLFPKAVRFLEIGGYRNSVLRGLVLSISSKTDSIQRPASQSFTKFTEGLPVFSDSTEELDLLTLAKELLAMCRKNFSSNTVIIPVLQTLDLVLDAGILEKLADNEAGVEALNALLDIAARNVARLKSVLRILTCMKIISGMLAVSCVAQRAITSLPQFLLHEFPKVRTDTAENLYLVMQAKDLGMDTDAAEEILLETDWSASVNEIESKVDHFVSLLKDGMDK